MCEAPICIMCVEDDDRLRTVVERVLGQQRDMRVVPGLDRADHLEQAIAEYQPTVVLMDLTMPGADPLEVLRTLTKNNCPARVIVLSGHDVREHEAAAVDAGAWAVLNKALEPVELLQAIRRVAAGEVVLPE